MYLKPIYFDLQRTGKIHQLFCFVAKVLVKHSEFIYIYIYIYIYIDMMMTKNMKKKTSCLKLSLNFWRSEKTL